MGSMGHIRASHVIVWMLRAVTKDIVRAIEKQTRASELLHEAIEKQTNEII
jgi:hypothetical protein